MNIFGYMNAKQALAAGFTHHGKYYGIPLWITDPDDDNDGPMVATKFVWMEPLMSLWHHVEQTLWSLRGEDPGFMFMIGAPIEGEKP